MKRFLCIFVIAFNVLSVDASAQAEDDIAAAWALTQAISTPEVIAPPATHDPPEVATRRLKRPIGSLAIEVGPPAGELPRDYAKEHGLATAPTAAATERGWSLQTRTWVAPAVVHHPLYFEEVNAERYGYTCSRFFQPAFSTVHFFGTVPYLPYLMAADCPRSCVYTLGHYRPGSCVPYRKHTWPLSCRGVSVETIAVVGMIAAIP